MSEARMKEITAWAVKDVPGMWLQVIGYDGNLAADPKHEHFFAPSYLECVVHFRDCIRFGIFVAHFAQEETVTPHSDTHRFFLLAHEEELLSVGISLTGRMLQFWGKYRNLTAGGEHVRYLTLDDAWEG